MSNRRSSHKFLTESLAMEVEFGCRVAGEPPRQPKLQHFVSTQIGVWGVVHNTWTSVVRYGRRSGPESEEQERNS